MTGKTKRARDTNVTITRQRKLRERKKQNGCNKRNNHLTGKIKSARDTNVTIT